MIEAAIFDLDGIIIDSEPLWKKAEINVFKTVGIDLDVDKCAQTTGLDMQGTIQYWYDKYPWNNKSLFQVYKDLMEEFWPYLEKEAELKDGFLDVLQYFKEAEINLAVASSSPLKMITFILKKFHLFDFFRIVNSSENEELGKPHPIVYLKTARKLNVTSSRCLVFEDSFNGVIAAKAAQMKVVAVPDEDEYAGTRFDFADLKLPSLKEFKPRHFEQLNLS